MSRTSDGLTVPKDVYSKLMSKLENLESELAVYKEKSPLVGVKWYGLGGFGIGLSHPVAGATRVNLKGYGDQAVIDWATWQRIKSCELARAGLVVRDDSVIGEMHISGVNAPEDDAHPSKNCFTDAEVVKLLKGSLSGIKKTMARVDSHYAPERILRYAERHGFEDQTKLISIRERMDELSCKYRWALLSIHDLRLACEQHKIRGWDEMLEEEMVDLLSANEIESMK